MEEFFITLPSNAKDHPQNTSSSFRTRLPETIKLKTDRWKCGLAELIYTNNFDTVSKQLSFTTVGKNGDSTLFTIEGGSYRDPFTLLNSLWSASPARRKIDADQITQEEVDQAIAEGNVYQQLKKSKRHSLREKEKD